MRIIKPCVELINPPTYKDLLSTIELAGRVCYKSENLMYDGSAERFVANIIKRGHLSVLEHGSITVRFICNRAIANEFVRHRIASYSQESTRYCNYSAEKFNGEITVIRPPFLTTRTKAWDIWKQSCLASQRAYFDLLDEGLTPQEARGVLPHDLKTELVITTNPREWRHILRLRRAPDAHIQARELADELFHKFLRDYPILFKDLEG